MFNLVLLQEAANTAANSGLFGGMGENGMEQLKFWGMMILIFVVFYFFMIRPQTKKQKELQKQRESMKKGDKVVTAGGIYGEIKEVQDTTFIITIAKDVTIKVSKDSVYADVAEAQAAEKK
jgi:preprotein translocase subunit YajC